MTLRPAEALGFVDGDAADTDFVQCFLHFVELERLDDLLNLLHASRPPLGWPPPFAPQAGSAVLARFAVESVRCPANLAQIKSRANWRIAAFRGDFRLEGASLPQGWAEQSSRCLTTVHGRRGPCVVSPQTAKHTHPARDHFY